MGVTQKDIARRLGISRTQVGAALAGSAEVADATRAMVVAAARELGYGAHSNHSARSLIAQRYGTRAATGIIGYCGQKSEQPRRYGMHLYSAQLQAGVQGTVSTAGLATLLMGEAHDSIAWDKIDGLLSSCYPGHIACKPRPQIPWVSLLTPWPGVPSVVADEAAGVRLAMRHLLGLGHRRIGYLVAGYWGANWHHDNRLASFAECLREAGIEADPRWVRHLPRPLPSDTAFQGGGQVRMAQWLAEDWRELGLTALLAYNDQTAMGAIAALQEAGLSVPGDVSVVGFDGTEAAECCSPRLTTVEVPLREIAATASELLLGLLAGNEAQAEPIALSVGLAIRESTDIPIGN